MACPQPENGYLRIATEIVKQLARLNLSAYEWRVLWAILLKTWGWRKKLDTVPLSQIAKMTGIQRPHVVEAKMRLLKKKILFARGGKLGFQKDYEQWQIKGYASTDLGTGGTDLGTTIGNEVVRNQVIGSTDSGTKSSTDSGTLNRKERNYSKEKARTRPKHKPGKVHKFTPPTVVEVKAYAESRGDPNFNAEKFIEYYAAADWHDSKGNPVRNWKQKLLSVWLKDEIKPENAADALDCGPCTEEEARRALGLSEN